MFPYLFKRTSKHFVVYFNYNDRRCIKDILDTLESNYSRIISDLNPNTPLPIIKIIIYPDIFEFRKKLNIPEEFVWSVGTSIGNDEIHIVSPLNPGIKHSYKSILHVLIHEFTHCVCLNISKYIHKNCAWLSEGIALYEAKQFRKPYKINKCVTLFQLNDIKRDPAIYIFGYTLIEYIVKNWGIQVLKELIKYDGNTVLALGISESALELGYFKYLNKAYFN